jgi:hypothetical protein
MTNRLKVHGERNKDMESPDGNQHAIHHLRVPTLVPLARPAAVTGSSSGVRASPEPALAGLTEEEALTRRAARREVLG